MSNFNDAKIGYKMTSDKRTICEVVGVFDDYKHMESAIDDLELSGFNRANISVLGSQKAVEEKFGSPNVNVDILEDNPEAPRSPDIKKEEMGWGQGLLVSGGLISGVVAAIIASGGVAVPGVVTTIVIGGASGTAIGAVLAKMLGDKYAEFFQDQIDNGGLVLWVNTPKVGMEIKAEQILKEHNAHDIHTHKIPVDSHNNPQVFGKAFVKLDELIEDHQNILDDDETINKKLNKISEELKVAANIEDIVPESSARAIMKNIDGAKRYAKDMAEEEQRIVAESMTANSNFQEREAEQYFALATDLEEFASDYKKTALRT